MNRPKITSEMILEAAEKIAGRLNADARTIANYYRPGMDGYELTRDLDLYAGWSDLTMSDVEILDEMDGIVLGIHRDAEKKWAEENDIQPSLPNGTLIKQGTIEGVCKYSAARYKVKEPGCTQDGRWLLVKFEDAQSL